MKKDIVADALNQMMNAKKVGKNEVEIKLISKVLVRLLEMMKSGGYIDFKLSGDEKKPSVIVKFFKLNECKAIKPRYYVEVKDIEKYLRRYLPSRNFGVLVISTSKGLVSDEEAQKDKLGGSLIAYFY